MRISGLIVRNARRVECERFDVPELEPDRVLVRVAACGLCTWEQRVYRGAKPTYPFWGGHEVCGVVEQVGDDVIDGPSVGDCVALALMRRCGTCALCLAGLSNHCAYVHEAPADGLPGGPRGLSDRLAIPPYQAIPLGPSVGWRQAALIEPLACVWRSIRRSGVAPGQTAVVVGAGTLGLMHAAALSAIGVQAIVCDTDEDHRAQAIRAGAVHYVNVPIADAPSAIGSFTSAAIAAVFCIRGGVDWIHAAVKTCGRGGAVVLFQSIRERGAVCLDANDLHYRELRVIGSVSQSLDDFAQAAAMAERSPRLFDCFTTEVVDYHDATAAFERSLNPAINRVLVRFDET